MESYDTQEIIAAIATPSGEGAVGVIRVSGTGAFGLVEPLLRSQLSLGKMQPRKLYRAQVVDIFQGEGVTPDLVDQVLVARFPGPYSYTGEDVVELNTHGGKVITGRVLSLLLQAGARLARPGEFTRRAYLHGKLDLTQAEAVMQLIQATSERAAKVALEQLQGRLGAVVGQVRSDLLEVLAHLEAWLDFPEEELECAVGQELLLKIEKIQGSLRALLGTAETGRLLREGIKLVLCGPPNSGKSSLLNEFLGHERAIVANQAGTTRDTLEEEFLLEGIVMRIVDTAGLRETEDLIEQEGVRRARQMIASTDYCCYLVDAPQFLQEKKSIEVLLAEITTSLPQELAHQKLFLLFNKIDLCAEEERERLKEELSLLRELANWSQDKVALVSTKTGEGLELLKELLLKKLEQNTVSELQEGVSGVAINQRHQTALGEASSYLTQAATLLKLEEPAELVAIELRGALESIGDILGKADNEELLGVVFKNFCIGK